MATTTRRAAHLNDLYVSRINALLAQDRDVDARDLARLYDGELVTAGRTPDQARRNDAARLS